MTKKVYLSTQQVQAYLDDVTAGRNTGMIERQAKLAGLSLDSFVAMHARYDHDKAVVAFPMFDGHRRPTGCRFRRSDGKKWSLKGGREGVFIARGFDPAKPVWILEGPTDSAAAIQVGFENVLGRPNCSGGASIILSIMQRNRWTPVVIIADPDEPGLEGATNLANQLPNPTVVITGPTDIRDFVCKTRLTIDARKAILGGLDSDEVTTFRTVYRNQLGKFHNFT